MRVFNIYILHRDPAKYNSGTRPKIENICHWCPQSPFRTTPSSTSSSLGQPISYTPNSTYNICYHLHRPQSILSASDFMISFPGTLPVAKSRSRFNRSGWRHWCSVVHIIYIFYLIMIFHFRVDCINVSVENWVGAHRDDFRSLSSLNN